MFVDVGVGVRVDVFDAVKVAVFVRVWVGVKVAVAVTGQVGVATGPFERKRTSSMDRVKAPVASAPHCRSVTRVMSKGWAGFPHPLWAMLENSTVTPAQEVLAVKVTPWWSPVVTDALGTWNQ